MNRTRLLLILTVLLVAAIYYAWTATPQQQKISAGSSRTDRHSVAVDKSATAAGEKLDFSGGGELPFHKPKRDLFRALYRPPKPQPRRIVVSRPPPPPPPPPKPVFTPPPAAVTPQPAGPKPIPPLKVLGHLQKEGVVTVFLASPQGEIFILKQGQRFADHLLVRELTTQKVVVSRDLTDPGRTFFLGDARPQRIKVIATPSNRPNVPTMQDLDVNTLMPENAVDTKPASRKPGVNPADNVNQADQ